MKNILIVGLLIIAFVSTNAQETKKKSKKELKAEKKAKQVKETTALLENNAYIFSAKNANPIKGKPIHLDPSYSVKIENDTIVSYLPFYGRAYSVPYGGGGSGMDFTQPIESYSVEKSKKGYMVKLKVKNESDNLNYIFHISENGSTTLNVISVNRQSISYYGNIEKIEENK